MWYGDRLQVRAEGANAWAAPIERRQLHTGSPFQRAAMHGSRFQNSHFQAYQCFSGSTPSNLFDRLNWFRTNSVAIVFLRHCYHAPRVIPGSKSFVGRSRSFNCMLLESITVCFQLSSAIALSLYVGGLLDLGNNFVSQFFCTSVISSWSERRALATKLLAPVWACTWV